MTGTSSRSLPTVTHVIPGKTEVFALTSLDNHLYVVRFGRKEVEVYGAVTFTLERRLPVPEIFRSASGIAACSRNKCLYLSDWWNSSINRVDLATDALKTWPVSGSPRGLSVNGDHNVLVTCVTETKLQEYTTDGRLVREMRLPASLGSPWHAIQMSTGDCVVSHWASLCVVSAVGGDEEILRRYEPPSSSSSDVGPVSGPRSLAVTKHGDILVADMGNNRILALNSSLTRAQVLPLPADVGLRAPCALYLDDTRDRLYIGEFGGKHRLIVLTVRAAFLETLF